MSSRGPLTLVYRTDAHLADVSPQSRVDDWATTLLGKLAQVGNVANEVNAAAVIDGGDLFHIKSPTRNSHRLVERVAAVHSRYTCPTYSCIGNHDVKYGNMDFLKESPLGVLFASGVLKRLYDEHEAVFTWVGDLTQKPTPAIQVRVVGVPYHGVEYDMERLSTIKKGEEDYLVVVAHMLASNKGGSMFAGEDILKYSDLAELDPDVWCFGHWHKDQGVKTVKGKTFINIGSLSRGSLNEDEVSRVPKCAILRFEDKGVQVEERLIKVEAATDVFDVEGRARQEARDNTMEAFADTLEDVLKGNEDVAIEDVVRKDPNLPDVVKERVLGYMEQAR